MYGISHITLGKFREDISNSQRVCLIKKTASIAGGRTLAPHAENRPAEFMLDVIAKVALFFTQCNSVVTPGYISVCSRMILAVSRLNFLRL